MSITKMELDAILSQPSLKSLQQEYAIQTKRFVLFTGAGLSANAGLPSWHQLRCMLEKRFEQDIEFLGSRQERQVERKKLSTIRRIDDPWQAFSLLKSKMNPTSYQDTIQKALYINPDRKLPDVLNAVWSLRINGMVTLNVDNSASISYSQTMRRPLSIGTGKVIGKKVHLLKSASPWTMHLHGHIDDVDTWIFTENERESLISDRAYSAFLQSLFLGFQVIFVGVSIDDKALTIHLNNIKNLGISISGMYWITDRSDKSTIAWASQNGIQTIIYSALGASDHATCILSIFDSLNKHVERYAKPRPVNPGTPPSRAVLSPADLLSLAPEEARHILSSYATKILSARSPETEKNYEDFSKAYAVAINHASMVKEFEPYNVIFRHTLLPPHIGGGAFGKVYRALDPSQEPAAIKLINPHVRDDSIMLSSFRQGIESLKILTDMNVNGVVQLYQAFEIPPTIIMEYIDGENLEDVVKLSNFDLIKHGLPILLRVCNIIQQAHKCQVIHRDIRPSNIMIRRGKDGFDNQDNVIVLDFDLSWHNHGKDFKISENMTTMLGYLAPEQLEDNSIAPRKQASVDAFGVGMTLSYVCTGEHPKTNERNTSSWKLKLEKIRKKYTPQDWVSVMPRLSRLIDQATEPNVKTRISFEDLRNSLEDLTRATTSKQRDSLSFDMYVEEIAARAFGPDGYVWSDLKAEVVGSSGITIKLEGYEFAKSSDIIVTIERLDRGDLKQRNISKYWKERVQNIITIAAKKKWVVDKSFTEYSAQLIRFRGKISFEEAKNNIESTAKFLKELRAAISFD